MLESFSICHLSVSGRRVMDLASTFPLSVRMMKVLEVLLKTDENALTAESAHVAIGRVLWSFARVSIQDGLAEADELLMEASAPYSGPHCEAVVSSNHSVEE